MLGARAQLVGMRVEVANQIGGILKTFGAVLRRGKGVSFERLVEDVCASAGMPKETVLTLLSVYRDLNARS